MLGPATRPMSVCVLQHPYRSGARERRRKPDGCLATIQSPTLPSMQTSTCNQVAAHNPSSYLKLSKAQVRKYIHVYERIRSLKNETRMSTGFDLHIDMFLRVQPLDRCAVKIMINWDVAWEKQLHSFKHQPVGLIDLSLGYSFAFSSTKASTEDSNWTAQMCYLFWVLNTFRYKGCCFPIIRINLWNA